MGYRHVLCAVELGTAFSPIVRAASRVAQGQSSMLSVVSVIPAVSQFFEGFDMTLEAGFEAKVRASATAELKQMLRRLRIPEQRARLLMGTPVESIVNFAHRDAVDLIVVGAHNRHGAEYLLGTTATGVLQRSHCDVLGVRASSAAASYQRVLVAVMAGADARRILQKARDTASGAEIHVVSVIEPLFGNHPLDDAQSTAFSRLRTVTGEMETKILQTIQADVQAVGLSATAIALHGTPSKEIKRHASEIGADLVVMGSGKHVGVGWMIGSTTNNVLHGAPCDTLVVRRASAKRG